MSNITNWEDLYETFEGMTSRERIVQLNRLGHVMIENFELDESTTDEDLSRIIDLLRKICDENHFSDHRVVLTKLIGEQLRRHNPTPPKVFVQASRQINVDAAMLAAGDPSLADRKAKFEGSDEELLKSINKGRAAYFTIGADGVYNVEARLISGSEPTLPPSDLEKLLETSPPIVLNVPTGEFVVYPPFGSPDEELKLKLEKGHYLLQVFALELLDEDEEDVESDFFDYQFVLVKTEEKAVNELKEVPGLLF